MYQFLSEFLSGTQLIIIGVLVTFAITFLLLRFPFPFLPKDQGREFAVNGELSKGKTRGVGLSFLIAFLLGSLLFMPLDAEYLIYAFLLIAMMLSGYLDDASEKPWNEYKKGFIDFLISLVGVITFINFNSTTVHFGSFTFEIPKIVFGILGIILFWASVNVTNCSDGVDGLCGSLCVIVILSFGVIFPKELDSYVIANFLFVAVLLAYLYFNSSPSSMLMGDAGSRALGFYLAIIALKSQNPFLFILLAGVLIIDGGLGLIKIFLKRFLKISILKNTRTPIHDHLRKNRGWSDTQVVSRFLIIQVILSAFAWLLV